MDFHLSDDQRAFAEMAQGLFADFCSDEQLRSHDLSGASFMDGLWRQCRDAGLHQIIVPEEAGGLGLDFAALTAVLEQQGQALALVPLWEQQLGDAVLQRFAPGLPSRDGESPLALSLAALSHSRGVSPRVRRAGEGWRLDGFAAAVPLADLARHALLVAQADDGPRLVFVDLAQAGVTREAGMSQHHQGLADLRFDEHALPAEAVLPSAAIAWIEPRAIACLAALQLGVTQRQLRRTVEYVSERRQFDRVIGTFQLVAGQLADGHIALEALRSALWQLVYRIDAGLGVAPQAWATRALANDMGHRVGHAAQHVHGGIGVDVTYPIHRFLYWSRALGAAMGGTEHQLARLGDWLADNDTLGWKYDLAEDLSADLADDRR